MLQLLIFMNIIGSMFLVLYFLFDFFQKNYMPPKQRVFIYRLNLLCFIVPFPVFLFYIRRYFDNIVSEMPVVPLVHNGTHIVVNFEQDISFALPQLNYIQILILLLWIAVMIYRYKSFSDENRKFRDINSSLILLQKNVVVKNSANITRLVDDALKELKLKKKPRIILQEDIVVPHVNGIFRPTLCLPRYWNVSEQVYYMAIKHELAHVKHRDLLFQRIALIAGIISWFNPILFYVCKKMSDCEELAADACACNGESRVDRNAYQTAILDLSAKNIDNHISTKGLGFKRKSKNFITERILTMKNKRLYKHKPIKYFIAMLTSVVVFLLSVIPSLAYNLPSKVDNENQIDTTVDMFTIDFLPNESNQTSSLVSLQPTKNELYSYLSNYDFAENDFICMDENGTLFNKVINSQIILCKHHNYFAVQTAHHDKNTDKGCVVTYVNAKRCSKCGYIKEIDCIATTIWDICPH